MLKKICLATTMVAALAFASFGTASTAEAGGCGRGGGYYSGYHGGGWGGHGFYPRRTSFYGGHVHPHFHSHRSFSPYFYAPRRSGLYFSIGF